VSPPQPAGGGLRGLWQGFAGAVERWLGQVPPAPSGPERFTYRDDEEIDRPFNWAQMRRLLGYMRPYRGLTLAALTAMLLGASMQLVRPFVLALAIDAIAPRAHPLPVPVREQRLTLYALAYLASYLVNWGCNMAQTWLTTRLGQSVIRDLRDHLYSHIQQLSLNFFDARPAGNVLVRVANDVNSLSDLFTNGIISILTNAFMLVGIIVVLLLLRWNLALACFSVIPAMMLLSTGMRQHIRRSWQAVRRRLSRINAHLNEALQGIRVTQAFTQEEENRRFFSVMLRRYFDSWNTANRWSSMFGPLVSLTGAVGTAIVFVYGTELYRAGVLSVGLVVAFIQYVAQFWSPISQLGNLYNSLLQAMSSSERIFQFLDFQPAVHSLPGAPALPAIAGAVDFRDVVFSYDGKRRALDGVTFHVEPGQTIALVGHTGAGKTSVVNLVTRFYDPMSGAILVDGHDLRGVDLPSLRRQVGVVLQDTVLFTGTIRENLRYGRLEATDAEVEEAARAVGADAFIKELPDGYETEVRERGSRFSVGQRQLLAFARALLADPRILILDEATSSIDTQTEMAIQRALVRLLKGRTSFVVAHRLSTIRQSDLILVFDHGRIVESGTHEQLLDADGVYASLLRAQFRFLGEQVAG
jgi:ATP-binding cassette subfamily B multidrug efflux pump